MQYDAKKIVKEELQILRLNETVQEKIVETLKGIYGEVSYEESVKLF